MTDVDGPVPLSFPALLRNPKLTDRYAYLRAGTGKDGVDASPAKIARRKAKSDNEGRRWIRRKENAHFVGNPHVVPASKRDLEPHVLLPRKTFPEPLPPYLSRDTRLPSVDHAAFDPKSANAGQFSLGFKGMRKALRHSGWRAQGLVRDIEDELLDWLAGGTLLLPDAHKELDPDEPGCFIGDSEAIVQLSRTPLQMIWLISDDPYTRYVVHCCARYHNVISFSKDVEGRRLTYLLRPNVTRPGFNATAGIDTPPATDYSSHASSTETDLESSPMSDVGGLSDIDESDHSSRPMSSLSSHSNIPILPNTPVASSSTPRRHTRDATEEKDFDGDESGPEVDLSQSIESLSLSSPTQDTTPKPLRGTRVSRLTMESRLLARNSPRSASSPSRSPVRKPPFRRKLNGRSVRPKHSTNNTSFYDYLFS